MRRTTHELCLTRERRTTTILNVLFLCTGNSARSILAEALMNQLPLTAGKFRGFSAGSHPKGEVHPFALDLLRSQRMSVEGLRSKSWDEFAPPTRRTWTS